MNHRNINPTGAIVEEIKRQAHALGFKGVNVAWERNPAEFTERIHLTRRNGKRHTIDSPAFGWSECRREQARGCVNEAIEWLTPIVPRPKAATRRHLQRRGPQRITPN